MQWETLPSGRASLAFRDVKPTASLVGLPGLQGAGVVGEGE